MKSKKELTRRSFIKGAALGAGAVAMAGIGGNEDAHAVPPPKKWDREADVVIIGAGGAGLMAAIQAKEAGAQVLVIEKSPMVFSSSTAINGGLFLAAGTKAQTALGVKDSPEKFAADLVRYGEGMNNPTLVKIFTENSAAALDWFLDRGMSLNVEPISGNSVNRAHRTKNYIGKDYVDVLWKAFQEKKIPIEFNTSASRLFYDQARKRVVGVEVKKGKKMTALKAKRAVVLASGGYTGDAKMFDRLVPALAGAGVLIGGPGNSGDGIKMAVKDVGAFPAHLQYSSTYPMGMEMGSRKGSVCRYYYFVPGGAILVNKEGKRFASEEYPFTKLTVQVAMQTEKSHFMIVDSVAWAEAFSKYKPSTLFAMPGMSLDQIEQEIKKEKVLFSADTIRELAAKAKLDGANLEVTVASFNGYVKAGEDPVFKRSKKSLAREIGKAPFYAVRMTFWTPLGLGGLTVNDKLQVLDSYEAVVRGLYAAGEVVGGVHGASYLSGSAMGWAHTSGLLVGKYAAAEKA
jgi:fumarate reductase flavoprotein subunit